jgi:predicted Rossmann-fold nucleotide-binding protein
VALPGGVGTWEEILEVLALRKLGRLASPIVLVNLGGYYDPLVTLIDRSIECGFSPADLRDSLAVVPDARGAIAVLEHGLVP